MKNVGDEIEKIKRRLLIFNNNKNKIDEINNNLNEEIDRRDKIRDEYLKKLKEKTKKEGDKWSSKERGELDNLKKEVKKNIKKVDSEKNENDEYIKKFLNPLYNKVDDYYLFLSDLQEELNKKENLKPFIDNNSFKRWFENNYNKYINDIYGSRNNISKLRNDSVNKNLNNISDFDDLYLRIKEEEIRSEDRDKLAKVEEIGLKKGFEIANEKLNHIPDKIDIINKNVKEIKETINPEAKNEEGNYSPLLLLRNNHYLNKIHEYISRGYGDLSREELIKKLKYKYNDENAKAFADAILIRKTEQQKRFEPVYKRLRDIRDANLIQRLPEDIQKGINDYEREQYAIKSRDVENYYLLPHEWKRLKAARDYGINPMLLRGIIKE